MCSKPKVPKTKQPSVASEDAAAEQAAADERTRAAAAQGRAALINNLTGITGIPNQNGGYNL